MSTESKGSLIAPPAVLPPPPLPPTLKPPDLFAATATSPALATVPVKDLIRLLNAAQLAIQQGAFNKLPVQDLHLLTGSILSISDRVERPSAT